MFMRPVQSPFRLGAGERRSGASPAVGSVAGLAASSLRRVSVPSAEQGFEFPIQDRRLAGYKHTLKCV